MPEEVEFEVEQAIPEKDEVNAVPLTEKIEENSDFVIEKGVLKKYNGSENHLLVPEIVTVIGDGAFKKNKSLISITLPDHIKTIGHYAFFGCRNLTSIELPEEVISIGDYAFKGCKRLPTLDIPESVRKIGRGACDCTLVVLH